MRTCPKCLRAFHTICMFCVGRDHVTLQALEERARHRPEPPLTHRPQIVYRPPPQ